MVESPEAELLGFLGHTVPTSPPTVLVIDPIAAGVVKILRASLLRPSLDRFLMFL